MSSFFRKLGWFAQRPGREAELREELQFHLREEMEERKRAGCNEEEARFAARRELGNLALVEETTRASWGWARIEQIARDAGYGLRQIRRSPGFSAIAIATLALGIGGVTAMFSAVDAVLIRPLPYADADRLAMIWDCEGARRDADDLCKSQPAPAEYLEWRRLNNVFTDLAVTEPGTASLTGGDIPEQVPARKATGNLWSVLGVKAQIGRTFTEEEDTNGARVAVISHGLWTRRYGSSPDVVGRNVLINGLSYEVIGVMPREFYFMPARDIDIWMPSSFEPGLRRSFGWHDAHVVARLKPGVTLGHAAASMAALSLQVTAKHSRPHTVRMIALREEMAGKTQTELLVLLYASGALLLIACVNLANLLLSRSTARSREVAVRAALGAARGRLTAQFLTESLVLAGLGTVAGLLFALPAMRFLELLVPMTMGAVHLTLDWRMLAFSGTVAMVAAVVFGLVPALRGARTDPQTGLREGGRGATGGRGFGFQHGLVVIETALAVVLLASGGLLLQTFQNLRNADFGIRTERLLTFETPLTRYPEFDRRVAFVNAELDQVRAIPGVVSVSAVSRLPLGADQATFYQFAGQPNDRVRDQVALFRIVTRDYFSTVGARLREGRFFEAPDRRSDAPVVVVNESFANLNFPGASPLGARFQFGQRGDPEDYWYRIVGVVKQIRETDFGEKEKPAVYLLHEQTDQWTTRGAQPVSILVRTAAEPASVVPSIRRAIQTVDEDQPTWKIQTVEEILSRQLATPRQSATLMIAFAVLALVLASLGIYGVLSYAVTQRTNEIGVRMALGATPGGILFSFSSRGLALTVAGLVVGLGLTVMAVRLMRALFYGMRPDYGLDVAVVSVILLVVATVACFVPARRASYVDPVVALRNE